MEKVIYRRKREIRKENAWAFAFVLMPLIGFLLFTALSMGFSIISSFFDYNPVRDSDTVFGTFIGVENYAKLFQDETFWQAVINTLIFLVTIPIGMFIGLLLATYIKKISHGSKFLRIVYYLPAVSSAVAINIIFRYLFDMDYGLINTIFHTNIPWLGVSSNWPIRFAIMIKGVWGGIGGTMLLYLAGLNSISDSYYEAARIDGASEIRQFFKITLPLVNPTSFYLIITGIIGGLQSYIDSQVFAEGHPGARTVVYYIWQYGIDKSKYGFASAAATLLGVTIMAITFIQFKYTHMIDLEDKK